MEIVILQAANLESLRVEIAAWEAGDGAGATNVTATVAQTGQGLLCTISFTPA